MYFLLKPITDNVSYYIYGQWETAEDYAEVGFRANLYPIFAVRCLTNGLTNVHAALEVRPHQEAIGV